MKTETIAQLPIVKKDPWLEPNAEDMLRRYDRYRERLSAIGKECGSLTEYANGYFYFGFQYDDALRGWWFREWLPGAKDVYLFGDFNGWQRTQLPLKKDGCGVWSVFLPDETYGERLVHGSKVKMLVHGDNGWLERIPSYIRRVVQDEHTKDYTGQLWAPAEPFDWRGDSFDIASVGSLLIYECHVGMAQEKEGVGTYCEFIKTILPHIKKAGYNTIQLMAVAEHPYYGSFGYHVSNFFAPSSRFGTPEELKALVRKAHTMGLAVIMDLVHSHYVKNINEGLNELDGTDHLYSPAGKAGDHAVLGFEAVRLRQGASASFPALQHQILADGVSFRRVPFRRGHVDDLLSPRLYGVRQPREIFQPGGQRRGAMLPDAGQPVDPRPVSARRHDCRGRQRYARHVRRGRRGRGRVRLPARHGRARLLDQTAERSA